MASTDTRTARLNQTGIKISSSKTTGASQRETCSWQFINSGQIQSLKAGGPPRTVIRMLLTNHWPGSGQRVTRASPLILAAGASGHDNKTNSRSWGPCISPFPVSFLWNGNEGLVGNVERMTFQRRIYTAWLHGFSREVNFTCILQFQEDFILLDCTLLTES